ncbi:MAG: hypothetical protein EAZ08_07085 [Cytophagales bacterium]|nr:MAG: hypothetical protein EAZ08_07085 [Cytophagales bacterium]
MSKPHRGRIQAQGGGVEKSESWAQDEPLSLESGLGLVDHLKSQLTKKELATREEAFDKLAKLVNKNSKNGIDAQVVVSFYVDENTTDERVDLEVRKGKAFIKIEK